jgi:hypothetical protein
MLEFLRMAARRKVLIGKVNGSKCGTLNFRAPPVFKLTSPSAPAQLCTASSGCEFAEEISIHAQADDPRRGGVHHPAVALVAALRIL